MTMLVRGGAAAGGAALPATATTGQVLQWNGSAWVAATPSASGTTPNATPTVPGLVQLAGDLGGTATAPTVAKINGAAPAAVATSGAYADLTGRPALATVATTGAYTDLTGRPALATVATTGSYGDLTGRPLLATVATTGAYTDLTGAPAVASTVTAYKVGTLALTTAGTYYNDPELLVTLAVGKYALTGQVFLVCATASTAQGRSYGSAVLGSNSRLAGEYNYNGGTSNDNPPVAAAAASGVMLTRVDQTASTTPNSTQLTGFVDVTTAGTFGVALTGGTASMSALPGSWLQLVKLG